MVSEVLGMISFIGILAFVYIKNSTYIGKLRLWQKLVSLLLFGFCIFGCVFIFYVTGPIINSVIPITWMNWIAKFVCVVLVVTMAKLILYKSLSMITNGVFPPKSSEKE
jgi:hypothetical protein